MSAAKPTPGPWRICGEDGGKCICRGLSQVNGVTIAHWYGNDDLSIEGVTIACPSVDEGLANARLIAASPDLYALMTELVAIFRHPHRSVDVFMVEKCEAALAKATGSAARAGSGVGK